MEKTNYINYKELMPYITEDVIIDILAENGSPVYGEGQTSEGQKYLIFRTVCHHGDSHKLYYYTETKTFHCYTNCGTMSVFDFVKKVRGYSDEEFAECVQYIASKTGYTPMIANRGIISDGYSVRQMNLYIEEMKELLAKKNGRTHPEISEFYDRSVLKLFDSNTFYQGWLDEGMSFETLHKYEISYYWGENHIIIPHVNINNDLVGVRRRSLNPEDANNKYMPEYIKGRFYDHPLGLNLYGLYQNQAEIARKRAVIVFEGEKSVLLSDTYFGNESIAVATCGFTISDWQIKALSKLGVETVYLAFDKDFDVKKEYLYERDKSLWEDYQAYRRRLESLVSKMFNNFFVKVILDREGILEEKDSPIDRGKDNFLKLMKSAKVSRENKKI